MQRTASIARGILRALALAIPIMVVCGGASGPPTAIAAPLHAVRPATTGLPQFEITRLSCAYAVNDLSNSGYVVGLGGDEKLNGDYVAGGHGNFVYRGSYTYLANYAWENQAKGTCFSPSSSDKTSATPQYSYDSANAVNAHGTVVGTGLSRAESDLSEYEATTWATPTSNPSALATPCTSGGSVSTDYSALFAVNDNGDSVGYTTQCGELPGNPHVSTIFSGGGARSIDPSSNGFDIPVAVSPDSSKVLLVTVAAASDPGLFNAPVEGQASLWENNTKRSTTIHSMDAAGEMNDAGVVVGQNPGNNAASFTVNGATPINLPGLNGSSGFADGVNNNGDVVGTSGGDAVLWPAAASTDTLKAGVEPQPIDLNQTIPNSVGIHLTRAWFVNDAGEIVVTGTSAGANEWAVLTDTPQVKSVQPSDGSAKGGQTIKVDGLDFQGATSVRFQLSDGTEVPAKSFSCTATVCTVMTPDVVNDISAGIALQGTTRHGNGAPGELTTDVRVTTPHGTSTVVAADGFVFSKVTVTNVSANQGVLDQSASSAPSIAITGTGFKQGKTNVFFLSPQGPSTLSVIPSSVTWDSSTQLTVRLGRNVGLDLPKGSDAASYPTNVIVHVGNDYAPVTPKDVYTFLPPEIKSLSIRNVAIDDVKNVTIHGTNLDGVTDLVGVCIPNGTIKSPRHPLINFRVTSSSTATATAPSYADTKILSDGCEKGILASATYPIDLHMVVGNASSPTVPADVFTYDGPVVTSVSAASKPYLDAGVPITVTGTDLDNVNTITIHNPSAQGNGEVIGSDFWTSHTSTQIVFPAPNTMSSTLPTAGGPFTQSSYPYEVHTLFGYVIDPGRKVNFSFLGPQLTSLTPSSGPLKGGKPITIHGNGFQGATRIGFRLSNAPSQAVYLSASQFKVSTDGRSVTIAKAPNLTTLVPPNASGPQVFDLAVDIDNAETPATASDQYTTP